MGLAERPYALLAELTYRCPLHGPYCSNPVRAAGGHELDTEQWVRVIHEAASLGVLQVGFSGGEPLKRKDLAKLVQAARNAGLYTNLITSGLGLTESCAAQLCCQSALLTGNPVNTDPVCEYSTHHRIVREAIEHGSDKFNFASWFPRHSPEDG